MASACGGHAVRIENETDTVPVKLGSTGVERLPREMNTMKIKDDKEMEEKATVVAGNVKVMKDDKEMEEKATVVAGNVTEAGHIIATTIGGRNGEPKQTISYMVERVVGTGSFGIVFQAKCLETGETVAIKKVLQDRRYKNRELQTMRVLDHPNVVSLEHCFFSTTDKDELYLNLVLEYVPEAVYRIAKHYSMMNQRIPLIYVKLYTYQVEGTLTTTSRYATPFEPACDICSSPANPSTLIDDDIIYCSNCIEFCPFIYYTLALE